ncbi:MAG: peptidase C15 [Methyloligellaceae bacterium]
MVALRVLLTGFGPFPGVPDNPSGRLAETLSRSLRDSARQDFALHDAVLPTQWAALATQIPCLHRELHPHLMVHFGVSPRATGLRLERAAHNRIDSRPDACGARPASSKISKNGRERLETRLPVSDLAAQLRAQGHEVRVSNSCGRYLCNALYYRSLAWADKHGGDALFVHVPLTRSQGGLCEEEALLRASEAAVTLAVHAMQLRAPSPSKIRETQPGVSA